MSTNGPIQMGSLTIPPAEQTPLVLALLEIIRRQDVEIKALRDEIHKLKGNTRRPKIEPSRLLKPAQGKSGKSRGKRAGSEKRRKTQELQIHRDVSLVIEGLPAGTQIEGYRNFIVQDLQVAAHNTRYRRTVYRLPDGSVQVAARPAKVVEPPLAPPSGPPFAGFFRVFVKVWVSPLWSPPSGLPAPRRWPRRWSPSTGAVPRWRATVALPILAPHADQ